MLIQNSLLRAKFRSVMEKGRNAKTSAPKGRPSGTGRENAGLHDVSPENLKREEKLDEKYNSSEGASENVATKHKNRNVDKGRDQQGKESKEL
jgi:hypothetical protein